MLTPEQGFSTVDVMTGYDLIIIMQMIDKLLTNGLITGKEVVFIAGLRQKAIIGLQSLGANFEETEKPKQGE